MKLETLTCNHCGGPLAVPDSANFVTCNHCGMQLAIRRTESATFTEQLGEIRSNQTQMMQKLAELERQNRLAQIDREWEVERERYLATTKDGRKQEPSEIGAVIAGIIAVCFGIFWTSSLLPFAPVFFRLFGVIFIVAGIGIAVYGYQEAKDYRAAQRRYQRRKSEALGDQGGSLRQAPDPP
jgi:hypothetical protein